MAKKQSEPRLEKRQLRGLKPFPLQASFFDNLAEHEIQALADDIQRNGLRDPIEILPKNAADYAVDTIISGHQRLGALLLNGETEATVLVRYDLANAEAAMIERVFLEANQNRRHLGPLARARVALRLFEIEKNREPGDCLYYDDECEARDRVGKKLGSSGRNLQRYMNVLKTPIEIQNAFENGQIPLVAASRVAGLSDEIQAEIAERIRNGESGRVVVQELLNGDRPHDEGPSVHFARSCRKLQLWLPKFEELLPDISADHVEIYRETFEQVRAVIDQVFRLLNE